MQFPKYLRSAGWPGPGEIMIPSEVHFLTDVRLILSFRLTVVWMLSLPKTWAILQNES